MGAMIDETVINDPAYRKLLGAVSRLHGTTTEDLSIATLAVDVTTTYQLNTTLRDDMMDRLDLVEDAPVLPADQMEEVVRKFLAKEKYTRLINWAIAHQDDDELDLEKLVTLATEARDVVNATDTDVATFSRYAAPDESVRKGIVPLKFNSRLNQAIGGGIAKGELVILMGAGGRGKTSHLAKIAVDGSKMGYNTLIVTMEINEGKYAMTLDRCLCGMTKQELLESPYVALQRREKYMVGEIWIKDWSARDVTVTDIDALLASMARKGERVDILIVDQIMNMKPRNTYRSEREGYKEVTEDLRKLANKYMVCGLTGWQANRSGARAMSLTEEHIGEDYRIMWTADTIITLNQNDEENRNKRMRYGIMKQREGTNRSEFMSYCDLDRMVIRDETAKDLADKFNLEVKNVKAEGSQEVPVGAPVGGSDGQADDSAGRPGGGD